MKPLCNMTEEEAKKQLMLLDQIDWDEQLKVFEEISEKLPKEDEEIIHVVIYPSTNDMPEGIYGTGVWGNIILNINPLNKEAVKWIPYVFAHEYHHSVWGDYWFCKKEGEGLDNSFLQNMILEGEADQFAKCLNPGFIPSWHTGVDKKDEIQVWDKLHGVLCQSLAPDEYAGYMFGNEELGIPTNAGYYFAIRIVEKYLSKHTDCTYERLLKTLPSEIYKESGF